jgi:hypothetical protein
VSEKFAQHQTASIISNGGLPAHIVPNRRPESVGAAEATGQKKSALMHQILERISWQFLAHKSVIGGAALCTLIVFAIFGAETLMSGPASPDLSYSAVPVPAEGEIIGFFGGDSRYHDGVSAYFRTSHDYSWVTVPNFSGCRGGDHIFLDQWGSGKSAEYRLRSPGCSRP